MVFPPDTILPIISNCLQYEVFFFQAMLAMLAVFQNGEITQLLFIAQEGVQGLRSWRTEALSNSWQKRKWFWIESKSRWNKSKNWKDWAAILNLPFPHYLLAVGLTQLGVGLPNDTTVPWRWMKVDAGVDQLYDGGGSEQKPWLTAGHQSSQRPITGRICREVLVFANLWTTCGNCCCDEVWVYIYWSHHLNVEILQISE